MAAPKQPGSNILDPRGFLAREWQRWFQAITDYMLTLTNDVTSVFGRTGVIVATAGDYTDAKITNTSAAAGANVKLALDGIDTRLDSLEGWRRWVVKTSAYDAVAFDRILADTQTTAAFTVTLPASPTTGDEIAFGDAKGHFGTANLTIAGNGKNIEGSASLVVSTNGDSFGLVYNGAEWRKVLT